MVFTGDGIGVGASRSRSRKSASDLVKIEHRSRKRSHKLDGVGVGRIRTVPFSSDSAYDGDAYDPVKTRLSESQAETDQPITMPCLFFGGLIFGRAYFFWGGRGGLIIGILRYIGSNRETPYRFHNN